MHTGLNIVIIGAGRGIGFQVTRKLTRQGHNLFCVSRNEKSLETLKAECAGLCPEKPVRTLSLDVSKLTDDSYDLAGRVGEYFPRIDVLLNNAGLLINKNFSEFTSAEVFRMFNTNLFSAAAVIRQLLPLMGGEKESHIVNIGGMGGFQGSSKFTGLSWYSASKAALACISECLAVELKEHNIKVNCLALGAVQTEMLGEAFPGYKAPVTAGEMAEFISNFMTNGHRFFNGKVLPVAVSTP